MLNGRSHYLLRAPKVGRTTNRGGLKDEDKKDKELNHANNIFSQEIQQLKDELLEYNDLALEYSKSKDILDRLKREVIINEHYEERLQF